MNATSTITPSGPAATPPQQSAAAHRRQTWLLLGGVLLLTFLAYSGTLRYEFVYDDGAQIVYNPAVQSWRLAPRLFTEHVWSSQPNAPATYYRPLFMLWCLINYSLFGLNPVWWHLTTVAAHLAATAMVFLLARRLLRDPIAAAIAALIVGLHPIHVESVAWVSGVADPLMTVFFVAAFLCYLRARVDAVTGSPPRAAFAPDGAQDPPAPSSAARLWWLAASLLLYALAMLTKEPGIVLLILVFACEWLLPAHRGAPRLRSAGIATAPYVALAALYLVQRFHVMQTLGAARLTLPAMVVPLTWASLLWFYAHKLVWPVNLSPFYDTPYVSQPSLRLFVFPLLGLAVGIIAFALWLRSLRSPPQAEPGPADPRATALFALAWIIAPLLPVLDLVSLEPREIAHDRYLYLPSVGFALLVALAIRRLRITRSELFGLPAAQVVATIVLVASLGVATARQSVFWANDLLLFYRGVRVAPTSESATNNLANALLQRGHEEGVRLHQQILRSDPSYWKSNYNLGLFYARTNRLGEAEQNMFRAAQLSPGNPQLFLYLGLIQMKNSHLPEAEHNIREAIHIWPSGLGAHYVLGLVLEQEGKLADAAEEFRRELALDRDQPRVQAELAAVEKRVGGRSR